MFLVIDECMGNIHGLFSTRRRARKAIARLRSLPRLADLDPSIIRLDIDVLDKTFCPVEFLKNRKIR